MDTVQMNKKIKLGIIGVGNMGTCHIETTAP